MFENIHRIEFDEFNKIKAMFSGENERVPFAKVIDPGKKNVEDWMGDLERMMQRSVKKQLLHSIEEYAKPEIPRKEWVL